MMNNTYIAGNFTAIEVAVENNAEKRAYGINKVICTRIDDRKLLTIWGMQ